MQKVDIIIVGDGIAAKCLIFELNKLNLTNILQISDDDYAPACSTRTTAINCLRGTKKGISPLGDLIVDSFQLFEKFYGDYNPAGICLTEEIQSWDQNHEKWLKRFGSFQNSKSFSQFNFSLQKSLNYYRSDAYIIIPELFYAWWELSLKRQTLKAQVTNLIQQENGWIVDTNAGTYQALKVVLATSYMTPILAQNVVQDKIKQKLLHSKKAAGTYLKFKAQDFDQTSFDFHNSFSFVYDEVHFIYRKQSHDVLIGATTNTEEVIDEVGMQEQYQKLKEIFGEDKLPAFDKAELLMGVRHKGQKREPYWGEINHNLYAIWGLYKNAFTLAFSAASDLSALIKK
jgi:hypothetical protein